MKLKDGSKAVDAKAIGDRWKEYCEELYKKVSNYEFVPEATSEKEPPPTVEEVKWAVGQLKNGKSPGCDEITTEMIKTGWRKFDETILHKLCAGIWKGEEWPDELGKSVFVVIPKKGDTERCENNRTIALISHCSKIILKIIAHRIKDRLKSEIAEEQAGFRPGRGTRDQVFNLKQIIEKHREFRKPLYLCFIDYKKAFDSVIHDRLWQEMLKMGFSPHLVNLIRKLYVKQRDCVRTSSGVSDWFTIGQGVRQGCVISPLLFNIYSEVIMRIALDQFKGNICIGGRVVTNLRYADDVCLLAGSATEMQEILDRIKTTSEDFGLYLHSGKTKAMRIDRRCY